MDEIIYDWSEVRGNVFRRKVNPKMLLPKGEIIRGGFMLKGHSIYSERELVSVCYDRAYVEAKLKNDFLNPLSQESLTKLQALLDKSIELEGDD